MQITRKVRTYTFCLFFGLSVYLSIIFVSDCLSICLSFCLWLTLKRTCMLSCMPNLADKKHTISTLVDQNSCSTYLPTHKKYGFFIQNSSFCWSAYLSICLSIWLSICLSVWLSVRMSVSKYLTTVFLSHLSVWFVYKLNCFRIQGEFSATLVQS